MEPNYQSAKNSTPAQLVEIFSQGGVSDAQKLIIDHKLPENVVQKCLYIGIENLIISGGTFSAERVAREFSVDRKALTRIAQTASIRIILDSSNENLRKAIQSANDILSNWDGSRDKDLSIPIRHIAYEIDQGRLEYGIAIASVFEISKDTLRNNKLIQNAVQNGMKAAALNGEMGAFMYIYRDICKEQIFNATVEYEKKRDEKIITAVLDGNYSQIKILLQSPGSSIFHIRKISSEKSINLGIATAIISGKVSHVLGLLELFEMELSDIDLDLQSAGEPLKGLIFNLELYDKNQLGNFYREHQNYVNKLDKDATSPLISKDDLRFIKKGFLSIEEAELLAKNKIPYLDWIKSGEFNKIIDSLNEHSDDWRLLKDQVGLAVNVFGAKAVLQYSHRSDLSRHDALFNCKSIVDLFHNSTLSVGSFIEKILLQINKDDAPYPSGLSFHEFNRIISVGLSSPDSLKKKSQNPDFPVALTKLSEKFVTWVDVFSSWSNFRRYAHICDLAERSDAIIKLQTLRFSDSQRYNFSTKLLFSPESTVSPQAVIDFALTPATFLNRKEPYEDPRIHSLHAISNWRSVNFLNLTPTELVNAWVKGYLDKMQILPPESRVYEIPKELFTNTVRGLLNEALGSRSKDIKGTAQSPKNLYQAVNKVLKEVSIDINDYLQGNDIDPEVERKIVAAIYNSSYGIKSNGYVKFYASVKLKSEVSGILAGNDTACCMPFGSSKHTNYIYLAGVSQFILELEREDQTRRTIAQSVLTLDREFGEQPARTYQNIIGDSCSSIDSELITSSNSSHVICCDNIQIAPNYARLGYLSVIQMIYQDFFSRYNDSIRVIIPNLCEYTLAGPDQSPKEFTYQTIPATTLPLALCNFSDRQGDLIWKIENTKLLGYALIEEIKHPEMIRSVYKEPINGIRPISVLDTLSLARLENELFPEELIEGALTIQHDLHAIELRNILSGRPNLSFVFENKDGKCEGYIIAYEGRISVFGSLGSKEIPIIQVSALTASSRAKTGAFRLIEAFTESYARKYPDKDVPLCFELRDKTSYYIIKKHFEKILSKRGIKAKLVEFPVSKIGDEVIHPILIIPDGVKVSTIDLAITIGVELDLDINKADFFNKKNNLFKKFIDRFKTLVDRLRI